MDQMIMDRREYRKERLKLIILSAIVGASVGLTAGFLWAMATMQDLIRTAAAQIPQAMKAIPF